MKHKHERPLTWAEDEAMQLAIKLGLCTPKHYSRATWPGDFTPDGGDSGMVEQRGLRGCREFLACVRRVADLSLSLRIDGRPDAEVQDAAVEGSPR